MKLYNSLSRKVETFTPAQDEAARIYSCGPTVYDHAHIGNLSAFIFADTLRRIVSYHYPKSRHVMNLTDVDDKTIKKSATENSQLEPKEALAATTEYYAELFFEDMRAIGNDLGAMEFIRATEERTIEAMQKLIIELYEKNIAYIADDGVYFSIDAYRQAGKKYGQLVEITSASTSIQRIQNDEYDKESAHDFALWKLARSGEPSWEFSLDGQQLAGRPGWHIECSAMSQLTLGTPFDIHTGGIDLKFPHHENEIAQSTASLSTDSYARWFIHNDHILVDSKKMAKSAGNFYTLKDLTDKGVDPLAFRLLVLQSHYRSPTNFSYDNVAAASNRLRNWRSIAALRHQTHDTLRDDGDKSTDDRSLSLLATKQAIVEALSADIDTPQALTIIDQAFGLLEKSRLDNIHRRALVQLVEIIDELLGLQLLDSTPDITDSQKQLIIARQRARDEQDWQASDQARDDLADQGISVRDTPGGPVWSYL